MRHFARRERGLPRCTPVARRDVAAWRAALRLFTMLHHLLHLFLLSFLRHSLTRCCRARFDACARRPPASGTRRALRIRLTSY